MKVTRYLEVNKIIFLPFEQPLSSPFSRRGNVFPLNPWKSKFCSNLWPNLGQLKSCQEFHNSPNLLFQQSCLLLTTDHANLSPRIFFPPLYLLSFIVLRAILRFLCRSLSLSFPPLLFPSSSVPNSACLLVHFMNFLLTNDTRKPNTRSYLNTTFPLYPGNRLQKCKEFITLFRHIFGINKSDRFL